MAISIDQYPTQPFDQAYGPNPVTVSGLPTDPATGAFTAEKYVLQIWRNGELIADLRQSPNSSAVAIFDIQNTLQNFVSPSAPQIEQTGYIGNSLINSAAESVAYEIRASYEAQGVVPAYPGPEWDETSILIDFGGTKDYYQVPYPTTQYIPSVTATAGCTYPLKFGKPFSDRVSYRLGSEITDGKPSWLGGNMRVYDWYVTADDMTTISYYNVPTSVGAPAEMRSIEAFTYWQYNGNTQLSVDIFYNVTSDGGGPNAAPGDGVVPAYPNIAITASTGPKNFQDFAGPLCTHYYVAANSYTSTGCASEYPNVGDTSIFYVHRFNIIEPTCNDFPEYQFSWLNSYGFRDYYSFSKRKNRSINMTRNEYLKEAADYNSTSYDVNKYDRGTTVYSQRLEETFEAFTDYISDADALFLEGLFKSADVKVRFNDAPGAAQYEWVPVSLLTSSYEEKTYRKDRLFQYNIRFKRAHNLKSQRG